MKKFTLEIEMEDKTWLVACRLSQILKTPVSKLIDELCGLNEIDAGIKEIVSRLSEKYPELLTNPEIKAVLK